TEIPALMIAGGRPSDPAAMARMMAHAFGGLQNPVIAYTGTANGDNPIFFKMMKTMLKNAGAEKVNFVHLAKKKPDLDSARKVLADADLIFLSGGEVEDGMNWLVKHDLTGFLRDLYRSGKRFLGVSAGVIMMGSHWVHWDTEGDDSTSRLFDCLAFTPALFDVHGESEDWVELKAALKLLGPGSKAYGMPGGSMISADSCGTLINLEKKYLVFINDGGQVRPE
ncbi:MAG: Type 1 glutamine amidotransferase-like domain-containing protein, partial [Treponema sp.]|nr:Type 1 glutamine amidotransferase-like domain-containing protein [Treponema sp.]